ncbi:MAG: hypothetical protein GEV11_01870 [Streptosporangiales bacterium]|nr:hypothetical protein [Streptosporangiales bacterium]
MQGRGRLIAAVMTTLIVVSVTVLATLATRKLASSNPGTPLPSGTPSPSVSTTPGPTPTPFPRPARGPHPPDRGAYLGAWVQPWMGHTAEDRITALTLYEGMVGRRLDVAHFFRKQDRMFPGHEERQSIAGGRMVLISWAGGPSADVRSGKLDELLRDRARRVRDLGVPVFLRWRWEMERPDLASSAGPPRDYIAAWKRARRIFAEEGAANAGWVWCPTAYGFGLGRAQPFYPGDDQVDWICADAYSDEGKRPLETALKEFLDWAKDHPDKPIMIGEYGATDHGGRRAAWLREVGAMAKRRPQIKALVYFDSNFEKNGHVWPYTLRDSPASLDALRGLLADPYFNPRRLPAERRPTATP